MYQTTTRIDAIVELLRDQSGDGPIAYVGRLADSPVVFRRPVHRAAGGAPFASRAEARRHVREYIERHNAEVWREANEDYRQP